MILIAWSGEIERRGIVWVDKQTLAAVELHQNAPSHDMHVRHECIDEQWHAPYSIPDIRRIHEICDIVMVDSVNREGEVYGVQKPKYCMIAVQEVGK